MWKIYKMQIYIIIFSIIGFTIAQNSVFLPSQEECGQVELSSRIIGGKPIQRGRFPWKVVMGVFKEDGTFDPQCGGSLISKRYIITVAQFLLLPPPLINVRIGDYDVHSPYDNYDHKDYLIISHIDPGFNKTTFENDILLAKLDREVQFNDFVKPACLPFNLKKPYFIKEKLTSIGWGRTKRLGKQSIIPLYVDVPVFHVGICSPITDKHIFTKEKNICAGTIKNNICKGDSGYGLHYLDPSTGKYSVVGMTSASDCRLASVFTRISPYLQWIEDNIDG